MQLNSDINITLINTLLDKTHVAIIRTDAEGKIIYVNKQAEFLFCIKQDELTGIYLDDKNWIYSDLNGNPLQPSMLPFARVKNSSLPLTSVSYIINLKNAKTVRCSFKATPIFNVKGEFDGIIAAVEDITELILPSNITTESEAMLKSVFRAAPVGIGVVKNRVFTWVNYKLQQMVGYTEDKLIGNNARMLYPSQEDYDYVGQEKYRQISLYGTGSVETRWLCSDGQIIDILLSSSPIDLNDQQQGVTFSALDITYRKQMKEQLRQSEKMDSIGRLAGGVAHDFNNMLNVIIGYTELSLNDIDPSHQVHSNLKEIYNAAIHSSEIVQQLLAFARKQTISPRVLNLNNTVENILNILKRVIGEDIRIQWKAEPAIWQIKMDPVQIEQILVNLCVNSRDAITGVGKIAIETGNILLDEYFCKIHPGSIQGEYAMLFVNDNGHGIGKEILSNIFEPFFSTKVQGKGTGLGLATVFGIVKQNDGFIDVDSQLNSGTTFRIYLPRYKGEYEENKLITNTDLPMSRGETILIVEDEPRALRITKKMLENQGYIVFTARTPDEALVLAQEHAQKIDLLLTDVIMPDMNGKELAGRLNTIISDMKCLYMSGYTTDIIAHRGMLDEGVNYIQKPFTISLLSAKVRQVLDN
jgi:PAS domain S-box-containing protein